MKKVLLNPSFNELVELAQERPDTVRIVEGESVIGLGNGYGHTHSSVRRAGSIRGGEDYILWKDCGEWVVDPMFDDGESVSISSDLLSDRLQLLLKDLVELLGE